MCIHMLEGIFHGTVTEVFDRTDTFFDGVVRISKAPSELAYLIGTELMVEGKFVEDTVQTETSVLD